MSASLCIMQYKIQNGIGYEFTCILSFGQSMGRTAINYVHLFLS